MAEWFKRQNDMVDKKITIGFPNFVSSGNIVKYRVSRTGRSGLVENIQGFDRFELIFFVHAVF